MSVVKYLNSIPFVYGLQGAQASLGLDLQFDNPSDCARKLRSGEVDLGLIPISEIDTIKDGRIIGDFCIGANGPVYSVCLVGERPILELERIYMDPHSRTSVNLARILARDFWKKKFEWLRAEDGFERTNIKGADGGVVIGDKVFGIGGMYPFQYDLAETWKEMTGLPIVFAAWVSNKALDEDFILDFNRALESGVNAIPDALSAFPYHDKLSVVDLSDYLTNKISYSLDKEKRAGMALFLKKLYDLNKV